MKVIDWLLTFGLIALGAFAVLTLGPTLESKFFPVYSKFQILKIEQTADGGSNVVFRYTKLRECRPAGVRWFIGDPGGAYRQIELLSSRPPGVRVNRPLGENTSPPYYIDVSPEVLRTQGFADIYNNCHSLWVTQSSIYP